VRSHLTYANVVSTVCLFILLGGTSYAVATGSIDSREIRNNTIRSGDLRNNEVRSRDIRNRTVLGRDVLSNTLNGQHINESKLGKVPSAEDAATLAGLAPSSFVQGGGRLIANTVDVASGAAATVLELPGLGNLTVPSGTGSGCDAAAPDLGLRYTNTSGTHQDLFSFLDPGTDSHTTIGPGASDDEQVPGGLQYRQLRVRPLGSAAGAATLTVFAKVGGLPGTGCRVSGQALLSG
jgi:hypothetical protein